MKVSIACLIYRSIPYLEFVKKGIEENTPMLKTGEAEFYFVVNKGSGTLEQNFNVIKYLKENNIPLYILETEPQPPYPQNIGHIYASWNFAVERARGEIIVLINSDMYPAKDWLENLIKRLDKNKVVSSLLVESGKIPSLLPHTVVKNFGRTPDAFQQEKFEQFAELLKEDTEQPFGSFMPLAIHKENFINAGGYPEGNRVLPDGRQISGDWIFFYERLASLGITHTTSFDSIIYHVQIGESQEGEVNKLGEVDG